MGTDKSQLRLGPLALTGWVRWAARRLTARVRVVRRDVVEQTGPLGGVLTGLTRTRMPLVLFLSCDMPFITARHLELLLHRLSRRQCGLFTQCGGQTGFPFLLRRECRTIVTELLGSHRLALRDLAGVAGMGRVVVAARHASEFLNINTPDDLAEARRILRTRRSDPVGTWPGRPQRDRNRPPPNDEAL